MSVDIKILEKRIYDNKPIAGDKANQYNFGYVLDGESLKLMGKKRSNRANPEADLFTSVQSKANKNLTDYPQGILNGLGSQLDITHTKLVEYDAESDGGYYKNVKIAFYAFDGNTPIGKSIAEAKTGNQIRTAIGQGDSFGDTLFGNRIRFLDKGNQKQNTSIGTIISGPGTMDGTDSATYGSQATTPSWIIKQVKDFPVKNKSFPVSPDAVFFNQSIQNWTDYLTNKHSDDESDASYIWIVGRVSGDERETIWPAGTKTDERDREYVKLRIAKSKLYNLWKNQRGETKDFERMSISDNYSNNTTYRGDQGPYKNGNYRDDYGNLNGHSGVTDNWDPVNMFTQLRTRITAPTFSPTNAIKTIDDGGRYANWVDTTSSEGWHCIKNTYPDGEQVGLNPKYDMDFVGFPSDFYTPANDDGTSYTPSEFHTLPRYFDGSKIFDFRPISFVSSSFNIDVQGYYDDNTKEHEQLRVLSSIPTEVTLKFKLAESHTNNTPEYIDLTTNTDYNQLKYYFFVVNFDWEEGEPETLEQIGDTFPINGDMWDDLVYDGLYDRQEITSDPTTNGYITIPADNYLEPGIKIIKVIIFSTIENNWESDDGGTKPYSDYVQAVHWKLATIKINLSNDGANVSSDFGDLGGDDFTYFPYPDVVNLSRTHTDTEWEFLTTNSGEAGPGPPSDPDTGVYKSSHPIIGGLAEESIYVTSLQKIYQTQPFNNSELDEKILFEKSYHLSPLGSNNELGNHLGQSDISQVRFFNKPYDIREMLNIETVYNDGADFYPHYDIYDEIDNPTGYWDGPENPSFPKEKVVGSIFISEYDHFKENCLVELNCGVLDGKTIKDTSGSGNKGILLGDYSIKKPKIGKPSTRDSYIKTPKTGNKDGAF
jgi:hypothetical protein